MTAKGDPYLATVRQTIRRSLAWHRHREAWCRAFLRFAPKVERHLLRSIADDMENEILYGGRRR